ncbi:MAG TPA: BON domain-containing protein [Rhodocyclaceae bacterium]
MKGIRAAALALAALAWSAEACAVVSSLLAGKGVATAMDLRSVDEVKTDTEIDAALKAKFLAEGDDFKTVSALVFAGRVVLVGFVRSPEVRRRAEDIAKSEDRYQRFRNAIVVGTIDDNTAADLALDEKINLRLTATRGIASVNMRWKVLGGNVFIMGLAQSREEANLAVDTVRRVAGVTRVYPLLDVGKT